MIALSASVQRRLAWTVFTVSASLVIASVPASLLFSPDALDATVFNLLFLSLPCVGILIARRQPGNRIAWILLAIGAVLAVGSLAQPYTTYGLERRPGSLPAAATVSVINGALWVPAIALTGTLLILLFPNGRLPSPRWRPVAWASDVTMGLLMVAFIFSPGTLEQGTNVRNPLGIDLLQPVLPIALLFTATLPLCMLACTGGLVLRFRRSQGVERLQVKWLAAAAALVASIYTVMMLLSSAYDRSGGPAPSWLDTLEGVAVLPFVLIPAAIGVTALKHGLYGIDRLISRTVSYAVITGILLGVYVGLVTVVSRLTPGGNSLSVAASTLAVATLFQPLRRRVQAVVDRRFNRSRYDAARTVDAFSLLLREEVDLEAVRTDLLAVVHHTLEPATAALWLHPPGGRSS